MKNMITVDLKYTFKGYDNQPIPDIEKDARYLCTMHHVLLKSLCLLRASEPSSDDENKISWKDISDATVIINELQNKHNSEISLTPEQAVLCKKAIKKLFAVACIAGVAEMLLNGQS
jgi:hypothetical protein